MTTTTPTSDYTQQTNRADNSVVTNYAAGLGAVVAYPTNSGSTITAPNPVGVADGSTSKYTAGNQVQSA